MLFLGGGELKLQTFLSAYSMMKNISFVIISASHIEHQMFSLIFRFYSFLLYCHHSDITLTQQIMLQTLYKIAKKPGNCWRRRQFRKVLEQIIF